MQVTKAQAAVINSSWLFHGHFSVFVLSSTQPFSSSSSSASETSPPAGKHLTDYKRGRGGRSSFSGIVATVFGASGALGRNLVNQLGKIGSQVIVPYRADPYAVRHLKLMGDLGQILFQPFHLEDEESLRKCMKYSNVVINCIGRQQNSRNFTLNDVHSTGAERIARIAKELGVSKLIHVSALNASLNPEPIIIKNGSQFLRSKALGEQRVRDAFPDAIIFRPSDMWGGADDFFVYYRRRVRRMNIAPNLHLFPIWRGGKETVKQPVFVGDVAQGIVNAIKDPDLNSTIIEAVGPNRYYLHDLIFWMFAHMRFDPDVFKLIPLNPLFMMKVRIAEFIQRNNSPLCMERLEREFVTDVLTPNVAKLEDLGVQLVRMEDRIEHELKPYRRRAFYWDALGEFPLPPNPPLAPDTPI